MEHIGSNWKKFRGLAGQMVLCLFYVFIFYNRAGANVAPPGFWGAGHGSTLIPIFKEDSFAISQLQMEKERIEIDLYRNFAVVKGTYWFKNHSDQLLKLRMGYPVNGSHTAAPVEEVRFDDLYHLTVFINEKPVEIKPLSELLTSYAAENRESALIPTSLQKWEDWYVWQMESLPQESVKVEVYFIVKTNSTLIQGYGRKEANAFEYILHTGASWRSQIVSGEIEVQLKDGLKVDDILGANPPEALKWSNNWIIYSFSDLEPGRSDDLILWYSGDPSEFSGEFQADSLFQALDSRESYQNKREKLLPLDRHDFGTPMPEFVYVLIVLVVSFSSLIIAGIWGIVWFFRRKRK